MDTYRLDGEYIVLSSARLHELRVSDGCIISTEARCNPSVAKGLRRVRGNRVLRAYAAFTDKRQILHCLPTSQSQATT